MSPFCAEISLMNSRSQFPLKSILGWLCLASSSQKWFHVEGWGITRAFSISEIDCRQMPMISAKCDCLMRAFRRKALKRSAVSDFSHGLVSIFFRPCRRLCVRIQRIATRLLRSDNCSSVSRDRNMRCTSDIEKVLRSRGRCGLSPETATLRTPQRTVAASGQAPERFSPAP
jgi:hypothetical protein